MSDEQKGPRWITAAEAIQTIDPWIDLGIIDLADVYRAGVVELIPYTAGRMIKSVFFTFDGFVDELNNEVNFVSPNVCDGGGDVVWAQVGRGFGKTDPSDTRGVWYAGNAMQVTGAVGSENGIVDSTPLYAAIHPNFSYLPIIGWQANTLYSTGVFILDSNGLVQQVQTPGLGGATEPVWEAYPDPTTDNEITWSPWTVPAVGKIHAFAEIIDVPTSTLPVPTTIDWVTQPTNTVAGETMAAFTLRVLDQNGEPCVFPNTTSGLYLEIVGGGGGPGTYNPTFNDANPTTGIFTFNDFVFNDPATGVILRAFFQGVGVSPVDSDPFNIT
jgi:hypothetical protein